MAIGGVDMRAKVSLSDYAREGWPPCPHARIEDHGRKRFCLDCRTQLVDAPVANGHLAVDAADVVIPDDLVAPTIVDDGSGRIRLEPKRASPWASGLIDSPEVAQAKNEAAIERLGRMRARLRLDERSARDEAVAIERIKREYGIECWYSYAGGQFCVRFPDRLHEQTFGTAIERAQAIRDWLNKLSAH